MTKEKKKMGIKNKDAVENEAFSAGDDAPQGKSSPDIDKMINNLKADLESAQEEAKQTYDRFLRVSAEFENYKKRSARETDEFKKYANESLINALLPVIDNLERAVNSSKENNCDNDSLVDGVVLILNEIIKVLEKSNVKPIESLGKAFDPNFHQAMMQKESDEHPDNTVLQELQKGYLIHNRLLRPAMVVVSKHKNKDRN